LVSSQELQEEKHETPEEPHINPDNIKWSEVKRTSVKNEAFWDITKCLKE
jgi:hypothetical protein